MEKRSNLAGAVVSALLLFIVSAYPEDTRQFVNSILSLVFQVPATNLGYYVVLSVFSLAFLYFAVTLGYGLVKWFKGPKQGLHEAEALDEPQIILNQHTFTPPPIVKFDFEVRAGKEEINALEVQVGHGHSGSPTEWVNLDLREYDFNEVEKGKSGEPLKRISLLSHGIQKITYVTFYVITPNEIRFTMRTYDPSKQSKFTKLLWITPFFEVYARFVGLTKAIEKRYIVVYNKPPWGFNSKTGWSNPHVELVEADSDRGRQLLVDWERIKTELREAENRPPSSESVMKE